MCNMCNICSSRFSPVPHPHNPGNMWVARCDYVRNLSDPETFASQMMDLYSQSVETDWACDGTHRYAQEHWVASHPFARPCDLYDGNYTWNYDDLPGLIDDDDNSVERNELNKFFTLKTAPRFALPKYLKPHNGMCLRKGTSKTLRIQEYRGLYQTTPPDDWWGHSFFQNFTDGWWPNHEYGWVEQAEEIQAVMIALGWNDQTWQKSQQPQIKNKANRNYRSRHRPFGSWGKTWSELSGKQRALLGDVLGYTKRTWNEEGWSEVRDAKRIRTAVQTYEPNLSLDRCEIGGGSAGNSDGNSDGHNTKSDATVTKRVKPWYQRNPSAKVPSPSNKTTPLSSLVHELETKPSKIRRVLLIATVPTDETHLLTLWSQLECFAHAVDHVVLSAPLWGRPYVDHVVELARTRIPHFAVAHNSTNKPKPASVMIEARYFPNRRYDVGLWCDAYESLVRERSKDNGNGSDDDAGYDEYGLVNDSVFALRKFSAVFDNLSHQNVSLASLTYSHTHKWNKGFGPEAYWVGSVFRAFDKEGIRVFQNHSCVPETDPKFCSNKASSYDRKACIMNNFEHDLAREYPCDKVAGIYPADAVEGLVYKNDANKRMWMKNYRYWRLLVDEMGFPVAKANEPEQIGIQFTKRENTVLFRNSPLLEHCTGLIRDGLETELFHPDLPPFETTVEKAAKQPNTELLYERELYDLPAELRHRVGKLLGYRDPKTWNRKQSEYSAVLAGEKNWGSLSGAQRHTWRMLGCSKSKYNEGECFGIAPSLDARRK